MQLHELKPLHRLKTKKRVGRGGKRGTYSGRGIKGQKSRAGRRIRPQERELVLRLPKRRGVKFTVLGEKPVEIKLGELSKAFASDEKVTPRTLLQKGLISKKKGKIPTVKILSSGSLKKRLVFVGVLVSAGARAEVEKAGGRVLSPSNANLRIEHANPTNKKE